VLINPKEKFKVKAIEKQIRNSFTEGTIPSTQDIFRIQLQSLVQKVKEVKVNDEQLDDLLEPVFDMFKDLSKEEVIKQFVGAEFNRFLDFYHGAGDINFSGKVSEEGEYSDRKRRRNTDGPSNMQRYFVSLGRKDGLNPGGLLRVICDNTGLTSRQIGRIDIKHAFSFFETEPEFAEQVVRGTKNAEYEGKPVKVDLTKADDGGGSGGGSRSPRSGSGGGGFSSGRSGSGSGSGYSSGRSSSGGGFKSSRDGGSSTKSKFGSRDTRSSGGTGAPKKGKRNSSKSY
jgi:ATP-dependent RNA helicase DeaD